MAREAMIELNCICESKDIVFLLDLLCEEGWSIENENGNIEYLPIGDNDSFSWKEENITYTELRKIIKQKQQEKELIGVCLYNKDTNHGISLLAKNLDEVIFSIDINRKTIGKERDSLTDFEWYFSNIIMILNKKASFLFSYKFIDYIA